MPWPEECHGVRNCRISPRYCQAAGMCLSPRPANKAELLEMADQEKISLAVAQQVALVGAQSLYDKINKNFKEGGFDAIFAKVQHFLVLFLPLVNISYLGGPTHRPFHWDALGPGMETKY